MSIHFEYRRYEDRETVLGQCLQPLGEGGDEFEGGEQKEEEGIQEERYRRC